MKRRKIRFILAVFLICLEFGATFVQAGQKQREQQEEETRQKLMEDMELGQMQDAVNQLFHRRNLKSDFKRRVFVSKRDNE